MTDKFFKQNFFNCDTLKYAKPRMKTLFIYFELKKKIHAYTTYTTHDHPL